jgi:hypothetical protein
MFKLPILIAGREPVRPARVRRDELTIVSLMLRIGYVL